MNSNGRAKLVLFVVAVSCAPQAFASQRVPEIRIEKKPVYLPAGRGQKPFNVTRHLVPLNLIESGGPAKDGIPALDHPRFISAAEADGVLKPSDPVVGLEFAGTAKAYPIRILNWHEVVNDHVGRQPVLVSWCPLCGSAIVYNPVAGGVRYIFGVSGLLYKRNLLLYDRETESLWSQLGGLAATGDLAGTSLELLPSTHTTWARWKREHPGTLVVSFQTGYRRDYSSDPYRDWQLDRRLVLAVQVGGNIRLYPFSQLRKARSPVDDVVAGEQITILLDTRDETATVQNQNGAPIPHFVAFLADARAFYPDAPIYKKR